MAFQFLRKMAATRQQRSLEHGQLLVNPKTLDA
jgi:hypothetical protein